jgi:predicted porin
MHKKLLAVAIAAGLAAPAAALAETTVYGKFHVSIDSYDNDTDGISVTAPREAEGLAVSSNSSRLGFKGSSDLGGGLSVIYQTESTIGVDGSGSSLSNRNTFLGLKGGWGSVRVGREDSPVKNIGRKVELFGDQVGDSRSVIRGTPWGADLDPRNSDMIRYDSPKLGPVSFAVQWVPDEDSSDNTNDTGEISASVGGTFGGLYVALGYASQQNEPQAPSTTYADEEIVRLVAKYDINAFTVTALYQTAEGLGFRDGNDSDMYGVGAAFKMGKMKLKAQYYTQAADDTFNGTTGLDLDFDTIAVGLDYKLAKKTTAYVAYAQTSNGAAINANPWRGTGHENLDQAPGGGSSSTSTGVDTDPSVISVGLIHSF